MVTSREIPVIQEVRTREGSVQVCPKFNVSTIRKNQYLLFLPPANTKNEKFKVHSWIAELED